MILISFCREEDSEEVLLVEEETLVTEEKELLQEVDLAEEPNSRKIINSLHLEDERINNIKQEFFVLDEQA